MMMQSFLENILRVYSDILENMANIAIKHRKQLDALAAAHNEVVDGHNRIIVCLENVDERLSAVEAYLKALGGASKLQVEHKIVANFEHALPQFAPAAPRPIDTGFDANSDENELDELDETEYDEDDRDEDEGDATAMCGCLACAQQRQNDAWKHLLGMNWFGA